MAEPAAPTTPPGPQRRRAASIALICIGLLILVPSGLCTAYFGIGFAVDMTRTGDTAAYAAAFLQLVPVVGGPPIVIGALLLWWGLRRDRRKGGS
jgi:hypothetical protein